MVLRHIICYILYIIYTMSYIPRPPGSEAVKALRGMPPTLKLYPRHDAPRMPEILDDKNAAAAKVV